MSYRLTAKPETAFCVVTPGGNILSSTAEYLRRDCIREFVRRYDDDGRPSTDVVRGRWSAFREDGYRCAKVIITEVVK